MKKLTTSVLAVVLTASFSIVNAQQDSIKTQEIEGVVVTALGVKREKKSLGYATQGVSGEDMADKPVANFANALQGEVAGLNIQSYGTMGGSANMVIRGYSSISGNNQALVVVDGVPILNSNTNSSDQKTGRGGYDYGNAAMDINPEDIESVNILKGAAATALYGSRAGQGAIIITTKKGKNRKGIGISFNSSITFGNADKKTLPVYQDKYGAGYGPYYDTPYFNEIDFHGNGVLEPAVPFYEDASYGAAFDPNLLVYQWNSLYPELSTYGQKLPWVAAKHTPNDIFQTALTTQNALSFGQNFEQSDFRLGFTNLMQTGILPNSELKKNTVTFNGSHAFTEKFKMGTGITYTRTNGKGRYGTGYDGSNIMQAFRQWFQTNVDIYQQRDAYFQTRKNITWNPNSHTNLNPIYTDNPYWTLYENYQSDQRDRYFGNVYADYKLTDWLSLTARFSRDAFTELREERTAVGSANVSGYKMFNQKAAETNYDLMGLFRKDLSENINLDGMLGWNLRVEDRAYNSGNTNGGLSIPGIYSLSNSVNPLSIFDVDQYDATKKVDGVYARASLGFYDTYFVEGTIRRDRSSALPKQNNTYWYPSVSGSIVFSNLIKQDWLSFGKIRANYAEVGNDTAPYQVFYTYDLGASFNGNPLSSNTNTITNPNLKEERSKDVEVGLEVQMFKRRLGFDVSFYNRKTQNLITNLPISNASGFNSYWVNGADVQNKGVEIFMNATPLKFGKFAWDMKVNWSKNESEVVKLADGVSYVELAGVQGGVSIGASLGEAFGVIRGRDFIYAPDGQKVVGSNGYYLRTTTSNNVIGNINPDWMGGVKNTFSYDNFSLSFLIDVKKGGDVFSLDTYYGYATGLYDFTAGNNHLGNPVRNSIANGGGVILEGVMQTGTNPDGSPIYAPNTTLASATTYANPWGYVRTPQAAHVYDASFVKLREASISYSLPKRVLETTFVNNLTLSLIGRNLWIIHKNVPYADPEAGLSSGNIQGYQSGSYPSVREIGASIKIDF